MASATIRVAYYGEAATTPAGTSGETTGITFNRADSRSGSSGPVPIPTAAGTNYSWNKYLALEVTSTGTTSVENRQVARSSAPPAGLLMYWATTSAYTQPSTVISAGAGDDADPDAATTGWTALTTTYSAYSTASATTVVGISGNYAKLVLGVSSTATYLGGPSTAVVLPDILFQYDEM